MNSTLHYNQKSNLGLLLQIRLPGDVSDDVDEDPTGNKALWDRGLLNGASQKVHKFDSISSKLTSQERKLL